MGSYVWNGVLLKLAVLGRAGAGRGRLLPTPARQPWADLAPHLDRVPWACFRISSLRCSSERWAGMQRLARPAMWQVGADLCRDGRGSILVLELGGGVVPFAMVVSSRPS